MAEFNVDEVLSQFGQKSKATKSSGLDIDGILSQFTNSDGLALEGTYKKDGATRVVMNSNPRPPISGISKEASDELNQTRIEKTGGENPRELLPRTNVIDSIVDNYKSGIATASVGLNDITEKRPGHCLL